MRTKKLQPKCISCGKRGLLDSNLCAICFKKENGFWSKKFTADYGSNKKKGFQK